MARPRSETLTRRESQIMEALWNAGSLTADGVRAVLPDGPHDSTVRTLLRILEAKGYVEHEVRGKAYVYRAAVRRERAQRRAIHGMLARLFGGSAESLVLRLLEDEQITPDQLDEIRRSHSSTRKRRSKRQEGPQ
ncbi:MAG TPA: BlaI/MecI/CopY family transcriptional regulator [Pirellulales bacterium]|nr:BlaI/MecI/CopY family transcriptional regulator [Pirellulales bacterium]